MQKDNILRRVFRNLLESDRNLKFWKEFNSIFEQSFKSLFGKLICSSKHSFFNYILHLHLCVASWQPLSV